MLRFITGETGATKTGFEVGHRLGEALANSDRFIVTNLWLMWEPWVDGKGVARIGLFKLLEELYPWADIEKWRARVFEFPRGERSSEAFAQIRWFFLYRPRLQEDGSYRLEKWEQCLIEHRDDKDRKTLLFNRPADCPRVHYMLDEVHEYFGAEEWASLEKPHRSWASQNRGAGDEGDLLTQVPGLVAKPLRKLAVECYYMVNHDKKSWLLLRQPNKVSYRVYNSVDWGKGDPVLRAGLVRGVKRFREGYDSARGGGAADFGERAPGLHWAWGPVIILCAIFTVGWIGIKTWNGIIRHFQHKGLMPTRELAKVTPASGFGLPGAFHRTNTYPASAMLGASASARHSIKAYTHGTAGYAVVWDDDLITLARQLSDEGRELRVDGKLYPRLTKGKNNEDGSSVIGQSSPALGVLGFPNRARVRNRQ